MYGSVDSNNAPARNIPLSPLPERAVERDLEEMQRPGSHRIAIISPTSSPRKSSSRKMLYWSENSQKHHSRGHRFEDSGDLLSPARPAPGTPEEDGVLLEKNLEERGVLPTNWLANHDRVQLAIHLSLVANVLLCLAKTYVFVATRSLAVLSSLVDSLLDLTSQFIFWWTDRYSKIPNVEYPAGRTRLEPVGIIIAAALMGMAALEVIQTSVETLLQGWTSHNYPDLDVSPASFCIILVAIFTKFGLWIYCRRLSSLSASARALSQDHLNDVLSNSVAIASLIGAIINSHLWYLDAVGAILISIYIAWSWIRTGKEHVDQLVGKKAEEEFVDELRKLASEHHPLLMPDIIRAYHFGCNFLVEVEVVMPEEMTVREAHDIGLELQRKIERFDRVERAFVHIDYLQRDYDEHKVPTINGRSSSG